MGFLLGFWRIHLTWWIDDPTQSAWKWQTEISEGDNLLMSWTKFVSTCNLLSFLLQGCFWFWWAWAGQSFWPHYRGWKSTHTLWKGVEGEYSYFTYQCNWFLSAHYLISVCMYSYWGIEVYFIVSAVSHMIVEQWLLAISAMSGITLNVSICLSRHQRPSSVLLANHWQLTLCSFHHQFTMKKGRQA